MHSKSDNIEITSHDKEYEASEEVSESLLSRYRLVE